MMAPDAIVCLTGADGSPRLHIFKNGQVAATKIGAEPKQRLMQWINSVV